MFLLDETRTEIDSTSKDVFDSDFRTAADSSVRSVPAQTPDPYYDPAYSLYSGLLLFCQQLYS